MSLSLAKAELIGVFLESLSYGLYILVFIQCLCALQRRRSQPSHYLLGTAVSLFILATAHLLIDITRNMEAFTASMETANYAVDYYLNYNTWKNILKSVVYVLITVISDTFILYRTFIVWGRNYFISLIPFFLCLADIGIGTLWVYTLSLASPTDNVYDDALSQRVQIFYSVTLGINVLCTGLIALKIWKIQRAVAPFATGSQDELSRIVAIVVESASVYSTILMTMIAIYASQSPAVFIFLNTLPPIIGIVFSSVIVRIGKGLSHGDKDNTPHSNTIPMQWAVAQSQSASQAPRPLGYFPNCGVQVTLSRTVHTHIDALHQEEGERSIGSSRSIIKTSLV